MTTARPGSRSPVATSSSGLGRTTARAEMALERPDDRSDPLAEPGREGRGCLVVLAGRADEGQAEVRARQEVFEVLPGKALVRHDRGAGCGAVRGLAL